MEEMNTYKQDTAIPIYIILSYGLKALKFPINPESLRIDRGSSAETVDIEGLGEVSVPISPKLATVSINSFFWQARNQIPSFMYVRWIENWQRSKKPAKLIVTRFNYSMLVTCERFSHEMKAGEEEDIYFELDLKEYRPYGARRLAAKESIWTEIEDTLNRVTSPVLFEIPRPVRSSENKPKTSGGKVFKVEKPYFTLLSITKHLTGNTEKWQELYEANKTQIADFVSEGSGNIPEGTELTIPDGWSVK